MYHLTTLSKMKSKLLIISLFYCFNLFGQSVPNTSTFTLQDVVAVTGGTSLTAAFANATGTFDPAYEGSKNSLYNFRNYSQGCPAVGDTIYGGVVAYLFVSGDAGFVSGQCHGLIAGRLDLAGSMMVWGLSTNQNVSTSSAIGSGNSNTIAIVSAYGSGSYAAKLCYDATTNGYTDWYLPSQYELWKIWENRIAIGNITSEVDYWSSTQDQADIYSAMAVRMTSGLTNVSAGKTNTYRVRAVRSF